jgi:hypothetical protein
MTNVDTAVRTNKAFSRWLDTLVSEKGLDRDHTFEVQDAEGTTHWIPLSVVLSFAKVAPKHEQAGIKNMVVRLDFRAAPLLPYFEHLAKGLARNWKELNA